jgi:hypothetical protein
METNPKKRKLTPEQQQEKELAKQQRKKQAEQAKAAKRRQKEELKALCKLDPLPQRKFVTINDKQLFQCTYTGIPCNPAYLLPIPTVDKDGVLSVRGESKGAFLNPSVALRWVEETQLNDAVRDLFRKAIESDIVVKEGIAKEAGSLGRSLVTAPSLSEHESFGGTLTWEEYFEACVNRYESIGGFVRTTDEVSTANILNKKLKSSGESKRKKSVKPKIMIFDGLKMQTETDFEGEIFVAVPIAAQKVKDQLLSNQPDKLKDIPLLRDCIAKSNGVVAFCYDPVYSKHANDFKEWVNKKKDDKKK